MSPSGTTPVGVPRVLVVDDDPDVQAVTVASLKYVAGWEVLTADSGLEAIDVCRAEQPDLVLLDLMMPGIDGIATSRLLQQDETTRDIPVILLTAKAAVGPRQPWDGAQVAGVISKPFKPMSLAADIRVMLGWPAPD